MQDHVVEYQVNQEKKNPNKKQTPKTKPKPPTPLLKQSWEMNIEVLGVLFCFPFVNSGEVSVCGSFENNYL